MVSAFIHTHVIFFLTFSASGDYKPPPEKDQLTSDDNKNYLLLKCIKDYKLEDCCATGIFYSNMK